jgi:hypothetical protein
MYQQQVQMDSQNVATFQAQLDALEKKYPGQPSPNLDAEKEKGKLAQTARFGARASADEPTDCNKKPDATGETTDVQ